MSDWDVAVFHTDATTDLLGELDDLDEEEIVAALADTCRIALDDDAAAESYMPALAAATIAGIWHGAPFTATDVIDEYPFIRDGIGELDEEFRDLATAVLDAAEEDPARWLAELATDRVDPDAVEEELSALAELLR